MPLNKKKYIINHIDYLKFDAVFWNPKMQFMVFNINIFFEYFKNFL